MKRTVKALVTLLLGINAAVALQGAYLSPAEASSTLGNDRTCARYFDEQGQCQAMCIVGIGTCDEEQCTCEGDLAPDLVGIGN